MKHPYFRAMFTAALLGGITVLGGCSQNGGQSGTGTQSTESFAVETSQENTSGSAETDGTSENDALAAIRERGQLIVGTEGTWSPWTYHDESDTLTGYDVEVACRIGESLGVETVFVEGEWDGLLAGMDAGRYDLVINGVEITDERAEKYDFSDPYAYNRTVLIVNGDNQDIHSFEDLEGKRTANTISGTYAAIAEGYGAEVVGVGALNESFELLRTGRVDATLNDEVTYYDYINEHPEENVKAAALSEEASRVAIPMRKGEETESLRAAVNEALEEMRASGELAELAEEFFGQDITEVPGQENGETETAGETGAQTQPAETEQAQDQTQPAEIEQVQEETAMTMNVEVNGRIFRASLEENTAVDALVEMMENGPVTIDMSDYSGFEKVGALGTSLPSENSQTTTQAGDIVLYQGNQIVMFYGSNSWSYTRLGHIEDLTGWEEALGSGDVTVTFSLED